jgi:hypothetical protein
MRKFTVVLASLILLLGNGLYSKTIYAVGADSSVISPYRYVISPNSPEWKNYSIQELKRKLNIPLSIVESMNTETLLNVVLDYC